MPCLEDNMEKWLANSYCSVRASYGYEENSYVREKLLEVLLYLYGSKTPKNGKFDVRTTDAFTFKAGETGAKLDEDDYYDRYAWVGDASFFYQILMDFPLGKADFYSLSLDNCDLFQEKFNGVLSPDAETFLTELDRHEAIRSTLDMFPAAAADAIEDALGLSDYLIDDPEHESWDAFLYAVRSPLVGAYLTAVGNGKMPKVESCEQLIYEASLPLVDDWNHTSTVIDGVWYLAVTFGMDNCDDYERFVNLLDPQWYFSCLALKRRLLELNNMYHFCPELESRRLMPPAEARE